MPLNDLTARTADPRPLALTRVGVGAAAVILALAKRDDLHLLASPDIVRVPLVDWLPDPSAGLANALAVVWLAAAGCLIAGLRARAAALLVAAAGIFTMTLDQQLYSNHLTLMVALSLLLALGRPGAAWSIDARRRGRPADVPYWPQFLVMTQVSAVYAFAALSKLNSSFLSGDVLAAYMHGPLVDALGRQGLAAAAWATVGVELFLAAGLWLPRLRPLAFVLGLGLHFGIALGMPDYEQLVPFGLMMVSTYVLFLEWAPAARTVVWDDDCSFCAGWVRLFGRLDWFGVHVLKGSSDPAVLAATGVTRDEADRAVQLVGEGERAEGFDAVRMVLEKCPATFLVAPVLGQWPISALGRRGYRWVAARRACRLPAADSVG